MASPRQKKRTHMCGFACCLQHGFKYICPSAALKSTHALSDAVRVSDQNCSAVIEGGHRQLVATRTAGHIGVGE